MYVVLMELGLIDAFGKSGCRGPRVCHYAPMGRVERPARNASRLLDEQVLHDVNVAGSKTNTTARAGKRTTDAWSGAISR